MENASKALLMAASVLIGVLVLSLAVYLFVSFGTTSKNVNKQIEERNLNKFNTQFTSYEGKTVNIHDVITVVNLATNNNVYYELNSPSISTANDYSTNSNYYITVDLDKYGHIEDCPGKTTPNYDEILKNNMDKTYNCEVKISSITKRVSLVKFTEK